MSSFKFDNRRSGSSYWIYECGVVDILIRVVFWSDVVKIWLVLGGKRTGSKK